MRLSIDTHAPLWWWTDDARLSGTARTAIADTDNEMLVSAASAREVATRRRLGRPTDVPPAAPRFVAPMAVDGFVRLPVDQRHALHAGVDQNERRDRFDRRLAAQAELENLTLLTCDEALTAFGGRRQAAAVIPCGAAGSISPSPSTCDRWPPTRPSFR